MAAFNVVRGLVITPSNGMLDIDPDDGTSLFEPKPSIGPDPLVGSIVIQVSDLPDRTDNFLFDAVFEDLADEEGNYQLLGDHNGNIAILAVDVQFMTTPNDGQPETAEIELVFLDPGPDGILLTDDDIGAPLPDDRCGRARAGQGPGRACRLWWSHAGAPSERCPSTPLRYSWRTASGC